MTEVENCDTDELLRRAATGDRRAVDALFSRHEQRIVRMIALRIDTRLAARLDPADVVQEAFADAAGRLPEYLRQRPLPFYPWLRRIAWRQLTHAHERHLKAEKRTVIAEKGLSRLPRLDSSTMEVLDQLVGSGTSPSEYFMREERRQQIQQALDALSADDREILTMRYFEAMSMTEIAAMLGISEGAASMRQLRALRRLREFVGNEESGVRWKNNS